MTEQSICCVNAAVYYYEDSKWQPSDGGISVVYIYHNPANDAYRVVAMSASDNQVVINSAIFKDLKYQNLSETFHTWADTKYSYGLNFASQQDANTFSQTMAETVQKLTDAAPAEEPEPEAEPEPEPEPEAEPEPEPEPAAPAAGRGRAAPAGRAGRGAGGAASSAGAGGAGRAAAGGRGRGAAAAPRSDRGAGGEVKDLDSLKEALIEAFREQLEIAKEEILRAVDEKLANQ